MRSLFPDLHPRDWSDDPLHQTLGQLRDIQSKVDKETSTALHNWSVFHWSTRFKLEAAEYHAKVIRHINRTPVNDEEDTVHYRLRHWQFDEFFFQLIGAFDTLLQEINALYKLGLNTKKVNWKTIEKAANQSQFRSLEVINFLKRQCDEPWLVEVGNFRNASTHRHFAPFTTGKPHVGSISKFTCHVNWAGFRDTKLAEAHRDDMRQLPEVCEDFLAKASEMFFECRRLMSEECPKAMSKGASP